MSEADDRYNRSEKGRARSHRYDHTARGRARKRTWKQKADLRKRYQRLRTPFAAWLEKEHN